jgi:hypothetical protein
MRRILSNLLLAAGGCLALVAAAKLVFGIAMDLPFLPPLSLSRVNAIAMIAGALACFVAAALVGRRRAAVAAAGSRPAA